MGNPSVVEPPTCFAESNPRRGRHFPKVTAHRSSPEFADYLLEIAERYPAADTIHWVLDNLSWGALYTPARQLAESGGDRHQLVLAAMPGATPHRRYGFSATRNAGLESSRES
jgi:hypothetical protein